MNPEEIEALEDAVRLEAVVYDETIEADVDGAFQDVGGECGE
jgi:hypothetical protein